MLRPVTGSVEWLVAVIVYGTSWPRLTLTTDVVLVIVTAPGITGSMGIWLLKIWLEPGIWLLSSLRRR